MEDEYKIKPIVDKFTMPRSDELFIELTEHLDKVCGSYMLNYDDIRKTAFTEMTCFLQMALIDHETKGEDLKARIVKIIEAIQPLTNHP